jgi:hypothetical protein
MGKLKETYMSKWGKYHLSSEVIFGRYSSVEHITFMDVQTFGNNLQELLDNAYVGREDWHGNEREAWHISELSEALYDLVVADLVQLMAESDVACG